MAKKPSLGDVLGEAITIGRARKGVTIVGVDLSIGADGGSRSVITTGTVNADGSMTIEREQFIDGKPVLDLKANPPTPKRLK